MLHSKLNYQIEPWSECYQDMKWLFDAHDEELNTLSGFPMAIDKEKYDEADKNGTLVVITARANIGTLVGYHWSFLAYHMHHKDILCAFTDTYYLHPFYRKGMNGVKFIKSLDALLKSKGARMLYLGARIDGENDKTPVFERIGYSPVEVTLCKRLD